MDNTLFGCISFYNIAKLVSLTTGVLTCDQAFFSRLPNRKGRRTPDTHIAGYRRPKLTTPENVIIYHNDLCLSPPVQFLLGAVLTPKSNWRQCCLCKILEWQTKIIMVCYGIFWSGQLRTRLSLLYWTLRTQNLKTLYEKLNITVKT